VKTAAAAVAGPVGRHCDWGEHAITNASARVPGRLWSRGRLDHSRAMRGRRSLRSASLLRCSVWTRCLR